MSQKVRILVSNNDKVTDTRAVIVSRDLNDICKQARNKLNIKKKILKVFNGKTGEEITENDPQQQLQHLQQDDLIVVSTSNDKPFLGKVITLMKTTGGDADGGEVLLQPESSTIDPEGMNIEENEKQMNDMKQHVTVNIIAKQAWLEDEAIKQLHRCAKTLKGVRYAIGMPDLHPGKGFPIGASYATRDYVYPHLIGSDIGCGMSLFKTDLTTARVKLDNWVNKLHGLEMGGFLEDDEMTMDDWLNQYHVEPTSHDTQLGTIGGGNHFAELQEVETILDEQIFEEAGLNRNNLYLLVHSGSRGYGHQVIGFHEKKFGTKGLHQDTPACSEYIHLHDNACNWAKANRHLIARKFCQCLSTRGDLILDVWHNNVTKKTFINPENESETEDLWLHRKGAAPTDKGLIVIPGSRGSFSYLVAPVKNIRDLQSAAYSAAHGAGRKWNRSKAFAMSKNNPNHTPDSLSITDLGSRVICEDNQLIYEEHPFAYKDIDEVVKDLEAFNVVKIVAVLKPLITYKTRSVKSK